MLFTSEFEVYVSKVCSLLYTKYEFISSTHFHKKYPGEFYPKKNDQNIVLITFHSFSLFNSSQYGNRTRVFAVRGRRLNPLTNWPFVSCQLSVPRRLV